MHNAQLHNGHIIRTSPPPPLLPPIPTSPNIPTLAASPLAYVLAGPPAAPANCSLLNQTSESLLVACSGAGPPDPNINDSDGDGDGDGDGLVFVAELYAVPDGRLLQNMSSRVPSFALSQLPPGLELRLELFAVNRHGRSPVVPLDGFTLKAAEKRMRAGTGEWWEDGGGSGELDGGRCGK